MDKKVFVNGKFYSLRREKETFDALAQINGWIIKTGTNENLKKFAHEGYEIIDLKGKTVIPGLVDAHTHFVNYAITLDFVILDGVKNLDEVLKRVERKKEEKNPGEWILGRGWDHYLWGTTVFPDKTILDKITPDNPCALIRKDGHMIWLNSAALKKLNITKDTPDPKGGKIERKNGEEPSGIVTENAVDMVLSKIPHPNKEKLKLLFSKAQKEALEKGLTGVHTFEGKYEFDLVTELYLKNKLDIRMFSSFSKEMLDKIIDLGFKSYIGNTTLSLGVLKLFADGSLGSRTAYMFEPYIGEEKNFGVEVLTQEELDNLVKRANENFIAVATHAIGDRAVHQVLNAYEKTKDIAAKNGLRNRIEHFQIVKPEDIKKAKEIGIIASMQPIHGVKDRDVADKFWGKRCKGSAYAWKTVLNTGIPLAFGTDVPVETLNPFYSMYTAVVRHDIGEESSWYPEERLTLYEAVSAYTKGAAYAEKKENIKGTLEEGKLADFLVLPVDVFKIDPEELYKVKPAATIIGGKVKSGDI